ncbi:FAD-dependent oxidoreductase [Arthrobacter sp. MPF02]|uniref:FAD-dependent oxidoreductase n=1 Tax=Arthrobacter sp. MPF02 TaxID=3388492 RepID=UPI003985698B
MAVDVVIIGGGPVGLYLAAALLQQGISVRVLEQRKFPNRHSRAIGIHPPALSALDAVQVAPSLVREGVQIRTGMAMSGGKTVGVMPFDGVSDAFPFVLALPQSRTEQLLEERVRCLDSGALVRCVEATGVTDDGGRVTVAVKAQPGAPAEQREVSASLVVAADGARSRIRDALAVPVQRRTYPDHYLMGDFADSRLQGDMAVLFLERHGIVESFPLPDGKRRWVVRLSAPAGNAGAGELARMVEHRTGILPDAATNTMVSAFSVRSTLADHAVVGRTVLVGDAAHEISPIGGQGMNLGWLDAQALVPLLREALDGKPLDHKFRQYERERRRAATLARRQAEINMLLGRPLPAPLLRLRNAGIGAAAATPAVNRWVARRFTMQ